MKLKCLIVEDDDLAVDLIRYYIDQVAELELIGVADNGLEAFEQIQNENIDLLFLDIQIPGLTGLQLLEKIHNPPLVIITTSYSEYALEGFRLNVTDYLLKPFLFERFQQSVFKAIDLFTLKQKARPEKISEVAVHFIFVKVEHKMVKIFFEDILFIKGLKQYVKIITTDKTVLTLQTIKSIAAILPADNFIRIHKSFIISRSKVDVFKRSKIKIHEYELPIGRTYQNQVIKYFA